MDELRSDQFVYIGPRGMFAARGENPVSTPRSIHALFTSMAQVNCKQMVLYFHGDWSRANQEKRVPRHSIHCSSPLHPTSFFISVTDALATTRRNLPKLLTSKIVRDIP